jgi:hypothetical protein
MNDENDLWPAKRVERHYMVCGRTLDRWEDNPALEFPKPVWINRRRYWRLADLQAWERSRAVECGRQPRRTRAA